MKLGICSQNISNKATFEVQREKKSKLPFFCRPIKRYSTTKIPFRTFKNKVNAFMNYFQRNSKIFSPTVSSVVAKRREQFWIAQHTI